MRTFDRMGVHLEQCESCRGIFLDHGELEQIASAEQQHYGAQPPPYQGGGRPDSPSPYQGGGHSDFPSPHQGGDRRGSPDSPRPYGKRRKKSFLENLFD